MIKWNNELRMRLYTLLLKKFGPYNTWETTIHPGRKRKDEYITFLKSFAKDVGSESWQAIDSQIAYARTSQTNIKASQLINWLNNKAVAYEAGFIDMKHLPNGLNNMLFHKIT